MKLYEITESIDKIVNTVPEDAEEQTALEKKLDELQLSFEYKAESIAKFLRNLDAEEQAIEEEVKRLKTHSYRVQRARDWLKRYLQAHMVHLGIKSIKTDLFGINVVPSRPSVIITSERDVPPRFKLTVISTKVDKDAIYQHYKETGEIPPGCDIQESSHMRIT